jgi:3-carboxy-cis,cis-muconate cycloisomerase
MGLTLDDDLLRDFFGTEEHRRIFDARARLQSWLDVERAIAAVQAELGVIPANAAADIEAACDAERYDLTALREEINATQHPIVAVVHALEHEVGPTNARFVHYGATTQDIMDTGQALQVRASLDAIERDVAAAADAAAELAQTHRETPQAGRTHGQHAVPITFGLKAATWLDELQRLRERMSEARPRVLAAEITGAAGTLAAYGDHALEIKRGVAERLGLTDPGAPWHATRDRIAELGALMTFLAGAAERVAAEVIRLQSTEFGELSEPLLVGHIGSSTMPQKRNPHLSEALVAKARLVCGLGSTLQRNGAHQHERDMGAWGVEWIAVPELMVIAGAVAADLRLLLEGLDVHGTQMRSNLELTGGQIAAEGLMMSLDPAIGRDRAHKLLVALTRAADAQGRSFSAVAAENAELAALLSAEEIAAALDPSGYTGQSGALVGELVGSRASVAG